MTHEQIEKLKKDTEGVQIGTYVADGAMNIQNIEHVENLFPGSIDKLQSLIAKSQKGTAPVVEPEAPKEEVVVSELSRLERINIALKVVHDSGLMEFDYYYRAIHQVILDKKILDSLSLNDFETMLRESGIFADADCPTANNLKVITIKSKFPDWIVSGKKFNITGDFIKVARLFLKAYDHPNL